MVWAALRIDMNSGRVTDWLPQGRVERAEYDRFVRQFGIDDYLIISWPGCTLDNPLVEQVADALRGEQNDSSFIRDVNTGPELVAELTSPPLQLSPQDAFERLHGIFVGSDHETTCLVVRTHNRGQAPSRTLAFICGIVEEVSGRTRAELRLGGSTFEAVALNEASRRTLQRFSIPAGLVSLLIAALFLRDLRMTIAIFAVSAFCQLMAVGVLDLMLGRMNVLLTIMPTLVYVLTMSGAVHLVNYCLNAAQKDGLIAGVQHGIRVGRQPCILATVSTAIGLLSLCVSQVQPVREFGLYAAICLMLSLLVLFALLPAMLLWRVDDSASKKGKPTPRFTRMVKSRLMALGDVVMFQPTFWGAVLMLILLTASIGLRRLQTQVDFDQMFPSGSEVVRNYTWLEQHLGPIIPIELLVDIPVDSRRTPRERVQLIGRIEEHLASQPEVGGTLSAFTFLPEVSTATPLQTIIQRRLQDSQLARRLDQFAEQGLLFLDEESQRWRVTYRLPARGEWNYLDLSREAATSAEAIVAADERWREEGVSITATGMMPVSDATNLQLFKDLSRSYLMAFALICPLMMLILRSVPSGLVAMIPNVTPTMLVFGGLGWLDISVDIGTVLCASVALGIAVDDTVHFLTWFRRGLADGLSRRNATRFAFDHCALAMLQTSMICGCGMLIFGFSDFVPASRFAILLAVLLASALLGDLLLLPALLCSPLGRLFRQRTKQCVD